VITIVREVVQSTKFLPLREGTHIPRLSFLAGHAAKADPHPPPLSSPPLKKKQDDFNSNKGVQPILID
jgi:hypothetical protein